MHFPQNYIWLIPLLPFLGAAINGLACFGGIKLPKMLTASIACSMMFAAFLVSLAAFFSLAGMHEGPKFFVNHLYTWISVGPLSVDLAFLVDPLSAVMILIVTGIGFLIHLYSAGYMWEDESFQRYFAYLNLFVFFMLLLVLGENVLLMFVGWEGVGLCSYLLIGFWFKEKPNAVAGMKAFIVNRVGDFAFICGFCLLYWALGQKGVHTLSFLKLQENAHLLSGMTTAFGLSLVAVVTTLFFIGATGKSAQIPLYVWLPDAMAGPTPVSALIHAATMVTAGVYMIGRNHFLFTMAPGTLTIVATVGVLTAFFAGTIGIAQNDIKKVLAYSTVSQLGYMFLGMGVGAYAAGIFHLMTHAFFKGLMFLGAGSVIHAMHHEQDMRKMGGLKEKIPWTYRTFLMGYLAIIGFPLMAGFMSKDEILWKTFDSGPYGKFLWSIGFIAAGVTAFYMSRLMFMTFFGHFRGGHSEHAHGPDHGHGAHEVHESPWIMLGPLVVLAILSVVGGFVGWPEALGGGNRFEHWLAPVFSAHEAGHEVVEGIVHETAHGSSEAHHNPMEYALMVISTGLAAFSVFLAWRFYGHGNEKAKAVAAKHPNVYQTLLNKYYVDEFYEATVVRGLLVWNQTLAWFDATFVDGAVNLIGRVGVLFSYLNGAIDRIFVDGLVNYIARVSGEMGAGLRRLQTGRIQNYVYVAIAGIAVGILFKMIF